MSNTVGAADVMAAVRDVVRVVLPEAKRAHVERIKRADLPALSFELIAYQTPIKDSNTVRKTLDMDIVYFTAERRVGAALGKVERLIEVLAQGLPVKDRYIHVSEGPEFKLIEDDLHVLIAYGWLDDLTAKVLTDSGHLGHHDGESTDINNIVDENETKPEKETTTTEKKVVDEDGNETTETVTEETTVLENDVVYMENLFYHIKE